MEQLHKTHVPTANHSTVECYQPIYPELLWQSLSLWVISICVKQCEGVTAWAPSDNLQWLNEHNGWSLPIQWTRTQIYDESEDTVGPDAYSLWCCSVMVHMKVIKGVRVKNDDAFSVFISWRWILEYLHGWVDYIWCVQMSTFPGRCH